MKESVGSKLLYWLTFVTVLFAVFMIGARQIDLALSTPVLQVAGYLGCAYVAVWLASLSAATFSGAMSRPDELHADQVVAKKDIDEVEQTVQSEVEKRAVLLYLIDKVFEDAACTSFLSKEDAETFVNRFTNDNAGDMGLIDFIELCLDSNADISKQEYHELLSVIDQHREDLKSWRVVLLDEDGGPAPKGVPVDIVENKGIYVPKMNVTVTLKEEE